METNPQPLRWNDPKIILKFTALLMLAAIVIVALVRDRIVGGGQWQVTVMGQGRVSYIPDVARLTMGVQIDKASTAESALRQLNQRIAKILPAIEQAGIPQQDIQTLNYQLYPQYDYRENITTLAGYTANQQVVVTIRSMSADTDRVSSVIEAASKAGVNQVSGLAYDASNLDALKQEARIAALSDAQSKAAAMAQASGVRLGRIVGWYENLVQAPGVYNAYYYRDGIGGGGEGAPAVPVGSQEIVIEMGLNYRIRAF